MISRLQPILRDVFDDPALQISEGLSTEDYEGWDSVAMIQIVLETEAEFEVRFTTDEVAAIRSVADILKLLEAHGA